VGWIAGLLVLVAGSGAWAADLVVIRSYNLSGVPARELTVARDTLQTTLRAASIDLVWRDCANSACEEPLDAHDLIVRIVAAPRGVGLDELGYSLIDLQERVGTLATVYADRVALLAERARIDAGKVLGRAVAHEVGHMLLGTSQHSATGLMRARWLDREVCRDFAPDWTWSRAEILGMHLRLIARSRGPIEPTALVASALSAAEPVTPAPTTCRGRCVSK
jgi:hypothetical protein